MSKQQSYLALYVEHRFKDQRNYYRNRREEFETAQEQANLASGIVMVLAALASSAAALSFTPKQWWSALAAVLPALAGLGQVMQRLFAYERLAKLYDDAAQALKGVGPEPNLDAPTAEDASTLVNAYVTKVERIFRREQGQWGQLTAELKLESPKDDAGDDAS